MASRGCVPSKSVDFCYVMKVYNEFNHAFKKVPFNFKDLESLFWVQNVLHNCSLIVTRGLVYIFIYAKLYFIRVFASFFEK